MINANKAVALGLAAVLGACAAPSPVSAPVDSTPLDALSPEERRLQAVESKLAQVQRRLDSLNTLRFDDENARMRDELRALRGEIEKARFDQQTQDRRGKDLYQDLDRRLQAVENRGSAASGGYGAAPAYSTPSVPSQSVYAPPQVSSAPAVQPPPVSAPAGSGGVAVISQDMGSAEEEGAYLTSFDLLKSGKYDEAVRGFRGVLDKWPRGRYADNAAYWMGEASYVKRDYSSALSAFQMVMNNYPSSPKIADATLKAGLTQIELKQVDAGRATLQQVLRKYPNSNAAKLAQQKLGSLGSAAAAPAPAAEPARERPDGGDRPRR